VTTYFRTGQLTEIRRRLSKEGQVIFDTEFRDVISNVEAKGKGQVRYDHLRDVLLRKDSTDTEIHSAFAKIQDDIGRKLESVLDRMANVAVRLSLEDRTQLTPHSGGMLTSSPTAK